MNLLESKLNSIAAIAIDTSLNSARIDYLNNNFYNKTDVVSALNNKQSNIVEAPATITLGQPADYTYFIDSSSKSYPLFASRDIVWSKYNNNISLKISNEFRDAYLTTTSASLLYARADEISNFETTTSMLNNIFQPITAMSSYITGGSLATYVTSGSLVGYITSGSLNSYQLSGNYLTNASLFQNAGNYVTTLSPLSGTYLSIIDAGNTYQLRGNYLTNASLFQSAGNYLTTFSPLAGTYLSIINAGNTYQLSGNYLTNASLFQNAGNYLTTFSPLAGTYLSIINAGNTYQTIANMTNYITSGSLTTYQTVANMGTYVTSSSIATTLGSFLTTANASTGYLAKPWVGGRFNVTLSTVSSIGQQSFVPTRNSTGQYTITWANPHPNGLNYTILASVRGAANITYGIPVSTNLQLYCYNQGTSNYTDLPQDCSFVTIP